jgi:5-methylcytosine-specific restriction protein A
MRRTHLPAPPALPIRAGSVMPDGAYQECRHPLCPHYAVRGGYCAVHAREAGRGPVHSGCNPTAHRFRRLRRSFLARHPVCNLCHAEFATVLDHIVPHRGSRELFWEQSNWQALCVACHGRKTARECLASSGWGEGCQNLSPRPENFFARRPPASAAIPPGARPRDPARPVNTPSYEQAACGSSRQLAAAPDVSPDVDPKAIARHSE